MKIKEVIIVEGKDDEARIKACVEAQVITTHGYGISERTFAQIEKAYELVGIIIFTDPDTVGKRLRKTLSKRFPLAKHAYIQQDEGRDGKDIGVENASCEVIRRALEKVHTPSENKEEYSMMDLVHYGLVGPGSKARRLALGRALVMDTSSAKITLDRLNHFGIQREKVEEILREL